MKAIVEAEIDDELFENEEGLTVEKMLQHLLMPGVSKIKVQCGDQEYELSQEELTEVGAFFEGKEEA